MVRVSLLSRSALALAAVGLIPLAIGAWMLMGINREGMTKQILRTHAVAASTAARRIEAHVERRRATVLAVAESDAGDELLQSLLRGDPTLAAISVLNADRSERVRVQRKETAHEMPRALAARPRGAGFDITAVLNGPQIWLVASAPMPDGGMVRIVSDGATLQRTLEAKELGDEAEIVLASPDAVLAGTVATLADFPPEMMRTARAARVDGSGEFGAGSARVIGAHASVDSTDWVVVSRQPAAVARAVEAEMQRASWSVVAIAIVLAAIAATLAWLTIVRPLRAVVEAQRNVIGPTVTEPEGDEIEQLRDTFAVIERRITDQENLGRVFLGRYHVLDVLGEGGMGTVFRGWDPRLQRHVALKTVRLPEDLAASAEGKETIQSLVREAVTIARFNHPNIVAVYDVEDAPAGAFVAMELVDGASLERYVAARGMLTPDETTLIGIAVASALETAHAAGLVHRDIKPPNVLLHRNGSIKVSDFGLADLVDAMHVEEGFVFGTPGYIAPECLAGSAATPAADLFSLGVLLYDCVTGMNPFQKSSVRQTFVSTRTAIPPSPRTINADVDPELERIILSLLAKTPAERLSSAAELKSRLEARAIARGLRWTYVEPEGALTRSRIPTVPSQLVSTHHDKPTLRLAG